MRHLLRSPSENNVNDVNPGGAQTLNASIINAMQPSIHFLQIIQFGGGAYPTFLQIKKAWGHFPMDFTLGLVLQSVELTPAGHTGKCSFKALLFNFRLAVNIM